MIKADASKWSINCLFRSLSDCSPSSCTFSSSFFSSVHIYYNLELIRYVPYLLQIFKYHNFPILSCGIIFRFSLPLSTIWAQEPYMDIIMRWVYLLITRILPLFLLAFQLFFQVQPLRSRYTCLYFLYWNESVKFILA